MQLECSTFSRSNSADVDPCFLTFFRRRLCKIQMADFSAVTEKKKKVLFAARVHLSFFRTWCVSWHASSVKKVLQSFKNVSFSQ